MENNYKYIIYQTINIINNKIYIGRHRQNNLEFDGYIGCGVNINHPSTYMNPQTAFLYAVKKYGTNNFKRSTLYIFDTEIEAILKEEEIVNDEFIKRKDTYNMILGGGGIKYSGYSDKKVYQFDSAGNLVKEWDNCYGVAEYFMTWKETIYSTIQHKHLFKNYYWSYNNTIDISQYSIPKQSKKVYKYSKEGKLLSIYESIYYAAKENGYKLCELSNRIKEEALTKGYYYTTTLVDEYIPRKKLSIKGKTLYLYTKDGNFYKEYTTEQIMNNFCTSNRKICHAIRTKGLINDYLISTEKYLNIEPYKGRKESIKVKIYDLEGNFVDECSSINELSRKYNLDTHAIRKCLNGTLKTTKGYIIKNN